MASYHHLEHNARSAIQRTIMPQTASNPNKKGTPHLLYILHDERIRTASYHHLEHNARLYSQMCHSANNHAASSAKNQKNKGTPFTFFFCMIKDSKRLAVTIGYPIS